MSFVLSALDFFLGWLLALPRDVAIILLALGTSFGMTLVRKWVTDQELLGRCAADLRRLKELLREAKRGGHKAAVRRLRTTMSAVRVLQLPAEGRVLAVSFVPLALLGWWGLERLEHYGIRPGEPFTFTAEYRVSAAGRLTHLVPPESGIELESDAVRIVPTGDPSEVRWTLRASRPTDADLVVRCHGHSVSHPLRVGRIGDVFERTYETGPTLRTRVSYEEYRSPLGRLVPDAWIPAPRWVWWYLLLTLILVPVSRRVLNVA